METQTYAPTEQFILDFCGISESKLQEINEFISDMNSLGVVDIEPQLRDVYSNLTDSQARQILLYWISK